jgi:hypothetical protein
MRALSAGRVVFISAARLSHRCGQHQTRRWSATISIDGTSSSGGRQPQTTQPGHVYFVSTPIGNLEDITVRACNILRTADILAAEDTRHTGSLLKLLGIERQGQLLSHHEHNASQRVPELISLARVRCGTFTCSARHSPYRKLCTERICDVWSAGWSLNSSGVRCRDTRDIRPRHAPRSSLCSSRHPSGCSPWGVRCCGCCQHQWLQHCRVGAFFVHASFERMVNVHTFTMVAIFCLSLRGSLGVLWVRTLEERRSTDTQSL